MKVITRRKKKKNIYRWLLGATDCTTTAILNTESTRRELLQLSSSKHLIVPVLSGESKLSQVMLRNCLVAKVPNISDTEICSELSGGNSYHTILGSTNRGYAQPFSKPCGAKASWTVTSLENKDICVLYCNTIWWVCMRHFLYEITAPENCL